MLDIVDGRLCDALGEQHDAVRDLLRQDPVVAPDHRGDGNLDVREDVGGGVEDRIAAHEHDQHGQHDERVRPLKRYFDNPHDLLRRDRGSGFGDKPK